MLSQFQYKLNILIINLQLIKIEKNTLVLTFQIYFHDIILIQKTLLTLIQIIYYSLIKRLYIRFDLIIL